MVTLCRETVIDWKGAGGRDVLYFDRSGEYIDVNMCFKKTTVEHKLFICSNVRKLYLKK